MWSRIAALIVKELWAVWRDRRSRFLLVAPPIIQLFVFAYAATFDVRNVTVAVLDEDGAPAARDLVSRFEGAPTFAHVVHLSHVGQVSTVIDEETAPVVVHIGSDFSRRLRADGHAEVQVVLDGRSSNTSQVLLGYISDMLARFNADWAKDHGLPSTPAALKVRAWFNANLYSQWVVVPGLIGILTMVVALVVTGLSVARERELGTFDQLQVTPLRPWEILAGKMMPGLLIGVVEGSVIVVAAVAWFDVPLVGSVGLLYLSLAVFLLAVIGIGLFISSLVETQQQAILGAFLFLVPAVILSGFATPIENMPRFLQVLTLANPIRHFLVIARGIFLKGLPFDLAWNSLWPMALIALFTLTAAAWLFRHRLE
jgi:ABC-2 type transport system permease protein